MADKRDNPGHWNSGTWNSGHWNSGKRNSGNWNSGNRNSGDRNSGNWNLGDRNSGFLNTGKAPCRIFDKDHSSWGVEFPGFFYAVRNVVWIESRDMDAAEKAAHPGHETTGGFLRTRTMHEAWRVAWDGAEASDRRKVLDIPNWDNAKFKIITGIDAEAELKINTSRAADSVDLVNALAKIEEAIAGLKDAISARDE